MWPDAEEMFTVKLEWRPAYFEFTPQEEPR